MLIVSVQIVESGGRPVAGQSYSLTCNVSDPTNVTSYHWKKEQVPLELSTAAATDETLTISSFGFTDIGNYTCEVFLESTQTTKTSSNWTVVPQSESLYY